MKRKLDGGTFRITVSISAKLRDRMKRYSANWSAITSDAFTRYMDAIDAGDEVSAMTLEQRIERIEKHLSLT